MAEQTLVAAVPWRPSLVKRSKDKRLGGL